MGRVNYWLTYTFPKPVFIYLLSVGTSIRNPVRNPDRTMGAGISIRNPVSNPDRTVGAGISIRNPFRKPARTLGTCIALILSYISSSRHFDFYYVLNMFNCRRTMLCDTHKRT